ncbi:glycosyltransferase family 4 protein [Paenibacillus chartarius]|uniref:Glycosyltransferase family 4 protein n=1 Tax=Paenibacillus chartarius TaxID=747481 RepID=A0ABV6DIA0_9BACL
MSRIAYISTYVPQKCGLATYTHHLRQSVREARSRQGIDPVVVMSAEERLTEGPEDSAYWLLPKHQPEAYRRMAETINRSDVSVVSLQHEFGIFGGEAGAYVLELAQGLKKPLVTTFHTVFEQPQEPYRSIQQQIARCSERIIVMNRKAIGYLQEAYLIPKSKIVFIPHGAPAARPEERSRYRDKLGWSDRKVLMTFGLLSRGKGLETVIRALPAVADKVPNVLYAIVGQTHPEVRKQEGEAYREELQRLIRETGLERHVLMIDKYVGEQELTVYLTACDLYLTPYPGMQQITSGTLAYAVGLGRPVLSTPYSYAQDLLGGDSGLLIPAGDAAAWGERIQALLSDSAELQRWEERIAHIGRSMSWPQIGKLHAELFDRVAGGRLQAGAAVRAAAGTREKRDVS